MIIQKNTACQESIFIKDFEETKLVANTLRLSQQIIIIMLFSVLMAHYNNSCYLAEAIHSVYNQTYTHWEIILIDDGSTDNFDQVIKEFENDDRIKIYRNEKNRGCSYTKKLCLEKATGEIAAFLDPDDTITPDALEIMVNAHKQMPDCSIVHSTHYVCDEKLDIVRIAEYPRALPENIPYLLLNDGSVHAFATFKMSCYDKSPGLSPFHKFDKAIDQELYYLLEEHGKVHFINKPLYYYRIHKGSISNLHNTDQAAIAHYIIAEEACLRRIKNLKESPVQESRYWIKKYRTRYYKIRILNSSRQKKWLPFLLNLLIFPFVGGMDNILSYLKKLPHEGYSLIKKSLFDNYHIIEE